jgi:uncharacterized protein with NRDE domain
MCTVSAVRSLDGTALRILVNRDEHRLRPVARPPALREWEGGSAIWPTDPTGGGTWVAANDRGLVFALINLDGQQSAPEQLSRGLLIPALAAARSLDDVRRRWEGVDTSAFAAFALMVFTRHDMVVLTQDARPSPVVRVGRAHLACSSALGDADVAGARRHLLAQLLRQDPDSWHAQSRFHQHTWPDRRAMSVLMSGSDACTVSITEVLLADDTLTMRYRPVVDGWPVTAATRTMALAAAARAA